MRKVGAKPPIAHPPTRHPSMDSSIVRPRSPWPHHGLRQPTSLMREAYKGATPICKQYARWCAQPGSRAPPATEYSHFRRLRGVAARLGCPNRRIAHSIRARGTRWGGVAHALSMAPRPLQPRAALQPRGRQIGRFVACASSIVTPLVASALNRAMGQGVCMRTGPPPDQAATGARVGKSNTLTPKRP